MAKKRPKIRVVYESGETVEFNPNKPKLLLAMERQFGVQTPEKHEHIAWLSWHALGRPEGDLDRWVDGVEAIEEDPGDGPADVSGEPGPS